MINKTRSGKTTSLQFGIWGRITGLDSEDFSIKDKDKENIPFLINNESDEDVLLDVINVDGVLITNARFRPGYDPRHIIAIKKVTLPAGVSLIWGN